MSKVLQDATSSLTIFNEVEYLLDDMIKRIKEKIFQDVVSQMDSTQTSSPVVSFVDIPAITVRDPNKLVSTKGRPKGALRFQSGRVVAQEVKGKQTRYCGECGEANHYKTTCPKLANQYNKDDDSEKGNKGKDKANKGNNK